MTRRGPAPVCLSIIYYGQFLFLIIFKAAGLSLAIPSNTFKLINKI